MKKLSLLLIIMLAMFSVMGNNIEVNNATCTGQNIGSQYTLVRFDLSWENSWRMSAGPANWDAAWVFVKYKVAGDVWKHATLSTSAPDHSISNDNGTTMTIYPATDGKGVFIYRAGDGTGNITLNDVLLRWNYGTNGVLDGDNIQVQVFAVEMVYVPEGPFFLGDGNVSLTPSTNAYKVNNQGNNMPYKVTSENAIVFCNNTYAGTDQIYDPFRTSGYTLSVNYPKGFAAFYCMKYEISQKQYIDFFNTLPNSTTPRTNRNLGVNGNSTTETYRNNFYWDGNINNNAILTTISGVQRSGDRACNYLNYADGCAYADWAALRPMSDLEYEKASRGVDNTNPASPISIFPVNLEYAWGNTNITTIGGGTITNDGLVNENVGTGGSCTSSANCHSSTTYSGPVRNGIFAAKGCGSDQRQQSGASYYGIMELSGNVRELTVSPYYYYNGTSSPFTGNNGDGTLNGNGNANVAGWYYAGTEVVMNSNGSYHTSYRGGSFNDATAYARTSDRQVGGSWTNTGRYTYIGYRCVRRP